MNTVEIADAIAIAMMKKDFIECGVEYFELRRQKDGWWEIEIVDFKGHDFLRGKETEKDALAVGLSWVNQVR